MLDDNPKMGESRLKSKKPLGSLLGENLKSMNLQLKECTLIYAFNADLWDRRHFREDLISTFYVIFCIFLI